LLAIVLGLMRFGRFTVPPPGAFYTHLKAREFGQGPDMVIINFKSS
jgi:hypothetical protein